MKDLYLKLKEAYSDKNLNKITAGIIELYKTQQYDRIRDISNTISDFIEIDERNISKCFSKLVMIYHPDKETYYNKEIEKYYHSGNQEGLNQLRHILLIQNMEDIPVSAAVLDDIDYSPEYGWDEEPQGNSYFSESENFESEEEAFYEDDNTFFTALKRKIYGRINIDMPVYYLEDLDEIEMAEYEVESLDGVEYCIHTAILDLSRNQLTDISELWNLKQLEELYLADNQIGYIDSLGNLPKLRVVDLSNNLIDDISPLLELENLEYVNIVGNKIPRHQIDELLSKDVIVVY
ncbi:MAG TPA: leucine-rich repeat domain-containing protein [Bacteroidales bacterium]